MGIQKLFSKHFGPHHKQVCCSRKIQWINYVDRYIKANPDFPVSVLVNWHEILKRGDGQKSHTPLVNETRLNFTSSLGAIDTFANHGCVEQEVGHSMNII
jgi:hypothetical protein